MHPNSSQQGLSSVQTIVQHINDHEIPFSREELHDPKKFRLVLIRLLWRHISNSQDSMQILDELSAGNGSELKRCFGIIAEVLRSLGVTSFCYDDWTNPTSARTTAILSCLMAKEQKVAEEDVRTQTSLDYQEKRNKEAQESMLSIQRVESELLGRLQMLQELRDFGNKPDDKSYRAFISEKEKKYTQSLKDVKTRQTRIRMDISQSAKDMLTIKAARNNLQL